MKPVQRHEPFTVWVETMDHCPFEGHGHQSFELVYILDGTGQHRINGAPFDYAPGHLFLVTPRDIHQFQVDTTTEFFFLQFNDSFLRTNALETEQVRRMEYIINNASQKPGCILRSQADKQLARMLTEAIRRELTEADIYNKEVMQQLINTLIVVVARNIAKHLPEQLNSRADGKILDILSYIQANIHEPDRIRASVISRQFHIAEHYLSRYFRKHCGETMQAYINRYRSTLIAHRLRFSNRRIGEIAAEMGFADESHLNKFFKRQMGISPSAYRSGSMR